MSGVLFLLPGTTVQDVARAVLAELVPATPVTGSVAERLARLDAAVSTRATKADVQVTIQPPPTGTVS